MWLLRLVVQDVWFSSRKSRVRLPQESPFNKKPIRLYFYGFYVIIYGMKRMPIVALVGQTNAGKSSILNRLARKNIAIVAREEGTTRDNVMATIDDALILIDTAG